MSLYSLEQLTQMGFEKHSSEGPIISFKKEWRPEDSVCLQWDMEDDLYGLGFRLINAYLIDSNCEPLQFRNNAWLTNKQIYEGGTR